MEDAPVQKTLDQIVADNLAKLREARGMSAAALAHRLGVARTTVYDMEGRADRRVQREFRWSELVALCGVLDTNLYELVLPRGDIEIAEGREFLMTDSDSPDVAVYHEDAKIGRDGLGWRVFGVPGDALLQKEEEGWRAPAAFAERLKGEVDRRISRLEEILGIGGGFSPDPDIAKAFEEQSEEE